MFSGESRFSSADSEPKFSESSQALLWRIPVYQCFWELQITRKNNWVTCFNCSKVFIYEFPQTKYKQTRRNFPRLRVLSYRLNKIWSIDLADLQSVQLFNNGGRYYLVAVDTLSRYLRFEAMKDKYAVLNEVLQLLQFRIVKSKAERNFEVGTLWVIVKNFGFFQIFWKFS